MAEPYANALKKAEQELAEYDAQAIELDRKRAGMRQTVAVLKAQLGLVPDNTESLTTAILLVLQAWPGYATAPEVLERLFIMGYNAQTASVRTILSRLVKQRKIDAFGDDMRHTVGYGWKSDLSKTERLSAQKELANKTPNKKPIISRVK